MANNSTNSCDHIDRSLATPILIVVYSVIAIFSLIGNTLVVAAVCKKKELRTNVNCFIASMALSDLLIPLVNLPNELYHHIKGNQSWIFGSGSFGSFSCKFLTYLSEVSIAVSTLTMVIIAAERFHCVLFPFRVSLISDKTRWRFMAAIWVASIALQGYYLDLRYVDSNGTCGFRWEFSRRITQMILIFVFQFAVPFAILVLVSSAIIYTLHRDKMIHCLVSAEVKRRTFRNRKITLMLVVLIVVYLAAVTPIWIIIFNVYFLGAKHFKGLCYIRLIASPAFYSNTAVNPLVYYLFIEGYHKSMKEILCCSSPKSQKSLRIATFTSTKRHQSNHNETSI